MRCFVEHTQNPLVRFRHIHYNITSLLWNYQSYKECRFLIFMPFQPSFHVSHSVYYIVSRYISGRVLERVVRVVMGVRSRKGGGGRVYLHNYNDLNKCFMPSFCNTGLY